jgi:hypothetical protein
MHPSGASHKLINCGSVVLGFWMSFAHVAGLWLNRVK